MKRRNFITSSLVLPSALASANAPSTASGNRQRAPNHKGKFAISLKADAIGASGSAEELLDAAIKYGYEALSVPSQWLEGWSGEQKKAFGAKARSNSISWGANGLPVEFRTSEEVFRKGIKSLPTHAKNLSDIGVNRIGTWLLSSHDTLTYTENMKQHADRLRETAKILNDHGIRLGLEYLGTTALRHKGRFAFLSSGRELKDLISDIGLANVGVILDSYHWYTAREGAEDLLIWKNDEIVAVDLNDANNQLTLDQQTDVARELPGATGVIDLNTFIQTLVAIGYNGPLRAEPFSRTLNLMDDHLAMQATYSSILAAVNAALGKN